MSTLDPKVRIAYNQQEKKAFAILALNLSDSQLSHIHSCWTSTEEWTKLCNIRIAKSPAYILFLRCKFFTMKMEEDNDMLVFINKMKALVDQLHGTDVAITDNSIYMMLLKSLPPS